MLVILSKEQACWSSHCLLYLAAQCIKRPGVLWMNQRCMLMWQDAPYWVKIWYPCHSRCPLKCQRLSFGYIAVVPRCPVKGQRVKLVRWGVDVPRCPLKGQKVQRARCNTALLCQDAPERVKRLSPCFTMRLCQNGPWSIKRLSPFVSVVLCLCTKMCLCAKMPPKGSNKMPPKGSKYYALSVQCWCAKVPPKGSKRLRPRDAVLICQDGKK